MPLLPWEWPIKQLQRIHVDYAGPFMGHMFLIVVDAQSKWPEVLLTGSTYSERTVKLLRQVFARYGLPQHLAGIIQKKNGTRAYAVQGMEKTQ